VSTCPLRYALFDLDDTLYPRSAGLMSIVSQRIEEYMALCMGIDEATIRELRSRYRQQYGTTMRGLLVDYHINPDDYLAYVHAFSVAGLLSPNPRLNETLACLPWRKVIFTNSTRAHSQQVLAALGVEEQFEHIFDIKETGYIGKPDPLAYQRVFAALGANAGECLVFDDFPANLAAAASLGTTTVLVGSTQIVPGVDFAISRIEDASQVAEQIASNQNVAAHQEQESKEAS
jgi:putative hydrolase of the HAD superfamily